MKKLSVFGYFLVPLVAVMVLLTPGVSAQQKKCAKKGIVFFLGVQVVIFFAVLLVEFLFPETLQKLFLEHANINRFM